MSNILTVTFVVAPNTKSPKLREYGCALRAAAMFPKTACMFTAMPSVSLPDGFAIISSIKTEVDDLSCLQKKVAAVSVITLSMQVMRTWSSCEARLDYTAL